MISERICVCLRYSRIWLPKMISIPRIFIFLPHGFVTILNFRYTFMSLFEDSCLVIVSNTADEDSHFDVN